MSGLPGKEDRLRDGKDVCPVFWAPKKGSSTHARSLPFACVHSCGCDSSLHMSFPLSKRTCDIFSIVLGLDYMTI